MLTKITLKYYILTRWKLQKKILWAHFSGNKIYKKEYINHISELSMTSMGITDAHFQALDEDSYNMFRSMPFLKSLSLSGKFLISVRF